MKQLAIVITVLLGLCMNSCDSWEPDTNAKRGQLELSALTTEVDRSVTVITRSDGSETAVETADYVVTIADATGKPVEEWRYAEMPEVVSLPVGDYKIEIKSHEAERVEWDRPCYSGSAQVTIKDGEITRPGKITCKATGAQVKVGYSDALLAALGDDYSVEIALDDRTKATFGKGESRTACFNVLDNPASFVATFTGTVNGNAVSFRKAYTGVEAAQLYKLTFSLNTGTLDPEIVVDVTVTDEDIDIDFGGDAPTITSETIDLANVTELTLENVESIQAIINIGAAKGIKELHVEIQCDNLTADDLAGVGLADKFDLAHPGDLAEALGPDGLGFPTGDMVIDKTEVVFDITPFLQLLVYFPGNNNFKLTVVDNAGNTTEQTVKFHVAE